MMWGIDMALSQVGLRSVVAPAQRAKDTLWRVTQGDDYFQAYFSQVRRASLAISAFPKSSFTL